MSINTDTIKLSVALVTRNRPESLEATLSSLMKQDVHPYEVVISDDSSEAAAIEKNKQLAEIYHCKYISGPRKGLYMNRNFVAKACTGTHVRTMDDDHYFPEGHMKACLEAIKKNPEIIYTIGEYLPNQMSSKSKIRFPIPGQLHPKGYAFEPNDFESYYGISCGASIYPMQVIKEGILNNENYPFGIVYLEYGARLYYLGYKLKPLVTTYIIHNDIQTSASSISSGIIKEARIFSILCLSFIYQPSFKNKTQTFQEITKCLLKKQASIDMLRSAYKNHLLVKQELMVKNLNKI